jgi:hypothetical protein
MAAMGGSRTIRRAVLAVAAQGTAAAAAVVAVQATSRRIRPLAPRRLRRPSSFREPLIGYARLAMADDVLPKPEPKEIDEKLALQLKHLAEDSVLKGKPYGDEKCGNCLYYLNTDDDIAYCWHPKLRILVGTQWWCQWWEKIED